MRRVIYSLFIDMPVEKYVSHHEAKDLFAEYYPWLLERQQSYADKIGVEYKHFVEDQAYHDYEAWFNTHYPEISTYNIINFWKIKLMYELAEQYDEVLYLDMDVIPVTDDSFFDSWDLDKGIVIKVGSESVYDRNTGRNLLNYTHHVRSPLAKFWHTKCMLSEVGCSTKPEVFNTAIVGGKSSMIFDLKYFDDFEETLDLMKSMINDDFYPDRIRTLFGYDNETVWGYKTYTNEIPYQEIGSDWHHFMYRWNYIPPTTKLVHCVNKKFKFVREWCEKNNL